MISADNSLVGSRSNDNAGSEGVVALTNGNYVVLTVWWDNGAARDAGAATWGDGESGVRGEISAANSLVGNSLRHWIGSQGVTALTNGNYVVASPVWGSAGSDNWGAVTWGDGRFGVKGVVSILNSLVGSASGHRVGSNGVVPLTNGNYVVVSVGWDNGPTQKVGAVTWSDGSNGITGTVSSANSLVGSTNDDYIGSAGVVPLTNGNYVVASPNWDGNGAVNAGATTWASGSTGITGTITIANSLGGSQQDDYVGGGGVTALTNGNYVVRSPEWAFGSEANAGAATWGNGNGGTVGTVTGQNSLIGASSGDDVSYSVLALTNGNYVVLSPNWRHGTVADAGAATWGDGSKGITGTVSSTNSLVGSTQSDRVGSFGATALTNGNYVVEARDWDGDGATDVGAVTWGDGSSGVKGPVSSDNSLVGSQSGDNADSSGVAALSDGNYVVLLDRWDNNSAIDAGAVTWGNGGTGVKGLISNVNSVVGSQAYDGVGMCQLGAVGNGGYFVVLSSWDNGATQNAGAALLAFGPHGPVGPISGANSVLGATTDNGWQMTNAWDDRWQQFVVGRPSDGIVTVVGQNWPLTVSKGGTGTGAVTSSPAAIECGATCMADVRSNRNVTLSATPDDSSIFTGWSGDCIGAGACVFTMDGAHSATASFALKTFTLTTQTSGTGAGAISGIPANPAALTYGTVVRIDAIPAASSTFAGWSGDCNGMDTCELTMNQAHSVTATFTLKQLEVTLPGPQAGGKVAVSPVAGQATEADAPTAGWPYGTVLEFTATPNAGYVFLQWGGLPSTTQNPQQVMLTAPLNVTAQFLQMPPVQDDKPIYLPVIVGPQT